MRVKVLVADCKRMLASLQLQLEMYEAGAIGLPYSNHNWDTSIEHIKIRITELEGLLVEHRDGRTSRPSTLAGAG